MDDFLQIAVGTFTMRPYVFAFLMVYLVAAVLHLGWRTTLLFTVCGYLVSFASEVSSITTGFPYGWYYYLDATKDRELWIAGVPFFDSLSYVFLCYCSYATALFILSPLKTRRWHLVPLETRAIRKSFAALFLGSLLQAYLDIIIDPVSLQGNRWFLGQIYGYREQGHHFGVPLSNYLGWWLVSAAMIFALQRLAASGNRSKEPPAGVGSFPFSTLLGPILGSFILTPLGELTRTYFSQSGLHGAHLIVYGALLIGVVLFLPQGAYPYLARLLRRAK